MLALRVDVRRLADLSAAEAEALSALFRRVQFDVPDYVWTPWEPDHRHALGWLGGELVSHAGLLRRTIAVGGRPVEVGGLYAVMTAPEQRGQGLASQVLAVARDLLSHDPGVEFGFLVCPDARVPFYEHRGWRRVADPVAFEQPAGRTVCALNPMTLALRGREWPAGGVDLRGLPW